MLTLSKPNIKISCYSLSLDRTFCDPSWPCYAKCYAARPLRMYRETRAAWGGNTTLWLQDPQSFEHQLVSSLHKLNRKGKLQYFRWHVAGEVPDRRYARMVCRLARLFPRTKFLLYTRRLDLFKRLRIPKNLIIRQSIWLTSDKPRKNRYPKTYIAETKPDNLNAITCPGKCDNCRACWTRTNVFIKQH